MRKHKKRLSVQCAQPVLRGRGTAVITKGGSLLDSFLCPPGEQLSLRTQD